MTSDPHDPAAPLQDALKCAQGAAEVLAETHGLSRVQALAYVMHTAAIGLSSFDYKGATDALTSTADILNIRAAGHPLEAEALQAAIERFGAAIADLEAGMINHAQTSARVVH